MRGSERKILVDQMVDLCQKMIRNELLSVFDRLDQHTRDISDLRGKVLVQVEPIGGKDLERNNRQLTRALEQALLDKGRLELLLREARGELDVDGTPPFEPPADPPEEKK